MRAVEAIRRFFSKAWLAAAPLIILFLLVAIPIVLAIVSKTIEHVSGPEVAERFDVFWVDITMGALELTFILAPIALVAYVAFRLTKWLVRKRQP
jgi:ABC-type sulfate transport system permease component